MSKQRTVASTTPFTLTPVLTDLGLGYGVPKKGITKSGKQSFETVTNFVGRIEELRVAHQHTQSTRTLRLRLDIHGHGAVNADLPADVFFGDRAALWRRLAAEHAPLLQLKHERYAPYLAHAIQDCSSYQIVNEYDHLGYVDERVYLAGRQLAIAGGHYLDPARLTLAYKPFAHELTEALGLHAADEMVVTHLTRRLCQSFVHMLRDAITLALLGHAFAAPLLSHRLMADLPRPILYLVGSSGCGKSEAARLTQGFFGRFTGQGQLLSISSTTNFAEAILHRFAGAVAAIDNVSKGNVSPVELRQLYRLLQGAYDGQSRGRLTATLDARPSLPPRCLLIVTAEQEPEGSSAVAGRSLLVDCSSPRKNAAEYRNCVQAEADFPALMAAYIRFVQGQYHPAQLRQVFERIHAEMRASISRTNNADANNTDRLAHNAAVNRLGLRLFLEFAEQRAAITPEIRATLEHRHLDALKQVVGATQELAISEKPSELFLRYLRDFLDNHREAVIVSHPHKFKQGLPECVGVQLDGGKIAIFPDVAMSVVASQHRRVTGREFPHETRAVAKQLAESGLLHSTDRQRHTTARKIGNRSRRVWLFDETVFGYGPAPAGGTSPNGGADVLAPNIV